MARERCMARQKKPEQRPIEQYTHESKQRVNNPPIKLVRPDTDPDVGLARQNILALRYRRFNSYVFLKQSA